MNKLLYSVGHGYNKCVLKNMTKGEEKMGNRLKRVRNSLDLSVYKLSEKTGLSPTYLSNLENDNRCNPSKETMDKIAAALETTVPDLFYGTD